MHNKELTDRIVKAWENTPNVIKGEIVEKCGMNIQNFHDVMRNGRRDAERLQSILDTIKEVNNRHVEEVERSNTEIQQI
ncbi:hypothetical protein [Aegicerativicinus sediminis]|uniref:hypothetical protein n=1 Tax=Aegicerativicinus sediminis TaxID=2893202 RepID=UPI001E2E18B8|nr:hypothetical protein [Aegicerativicinus sediminis]